MFECVYLRKAKSRYLNLHSLEDKLIRNALQLTLLDITTTNMHPVCKGKQVFIVRGLSMLAGFQEE